jgi:hypothetical protein
MKSYRGSVMELETHFLIASRLSYITKPQLESVLNNAAELGRMLAGLISKLKARRESPDTWHLTPDTFSVGGLSPCSSSFATTAGSS